MGKRKYKILAFDPGLTTTGWSVLEGELGSGDLTVTRIGEIHPGPATDKVSFRDQIEQYDKRTVSLAYLREQVVHLLDDIRPDFVAAEDIYINMHRPMAYSALCMVICMMKFVCHDVVSKKLVLIPTKIAKLETTKYGGSGKVDVFSSLQSHKHVKFKNEMDKCHMSEHQADSIAVGIAFNNRFQDYISQELEKQNV